jgi:hypothetical protein
MKRIFALSMLLCCALPAFSQPGVTVRDGKLWKDGKPLRAVGVNYFNAFLRTINEPPDTSYEAGFATLAKHKIAFARFAACGFWPNEFDLYKNDKEAYFKRMDGVVRAAEKHGIGLVPSLFWHWSTVPDLAGEPMDQWGNPDSKTIAWMRNYTREIVTRYNHSPAIWGWEFGNEYNLPVDLPNAAQHRPATWPVLGTPATRSERDDLKLPMLQTALREFAREVRRHDSYRFITSGHAMPRASAWHQWKENSWKSDSPAQAAQILLEQNPDPLNVISVHIYSEAYKQLPQAAKAAADAQKPLFVGEFQVKNGVDSPKEFDEWLAAMQREGVALAAMWVFDYKPQDKDYNVIESNERGWQLPKIGAANEDWNK